MPELHKLYSTLKTASLRRFRHVAFPYGDLYYDLLIQFYRYGFITSVTFGSNNEPYWLGGQIKLVEEAKGHESIPDRIHPIRLWVEMKYVRGIPAIGDLKQISKPSKPAFATSKELADILAHKSKRFPILFNPSRCVFVATKYGVMELSKAVSLGLNAEILVSVC